MIDKHIIDTFLMNRLISKSKTFQTLNIDTKEHIQVKAEMNLCKLILERIEVGAFDYKYNELEQVLNNFDDYIND